jgi:hypothetical protein
MDNQIFKSKKPEKCKKIFHCERAVRKWREEEDKLLLQLAEKNKFRRWKKIALEMKDRTSSQCYERFRKIRPEIKKGPWTIEEDESLRELIDIHGKKWSKISRIMKYRTGKQIRDRYNHSLDNKINKKKYTAEEENVIKCLYSKYGSAWSLIAKNLPGRTSQQIKNRFYSKLNDRLLFNQNYQKPRVDNFSFNQSPGDKIFHNIISEASESPNKNKNEEINSESKGEKFLRQTSMSCLSKRKICQSKRKFLRIKKSLGKKTRTKRLKENYDFLDGNIQSCSLLNPKIEINCNDISSIANTCLEEMYKFLNENYSNYYDLLVSPHSLDEISVTFFPDLD